MQIDHALALARRLMAEHELHGWTVVADRAKTRAGVCRFGKRQIGLSRPLTELHSEARPRVAGQGHADRVVGGALPLRGRTARARVVAGHMSCRPSQQPP
jgi:hypothetical protein